MDISIKDHRICLGGDPVRQVPTKNHGGVIKATAAVCHDTASGLTPNGDIDWLARSSPNSSANCLIDRKGIITQFAPMNVKTWHAGKSKWNGRDLCNGFTIGIEHDNPGILQRVGPGIYKGVTTIKEGPAPYGPDCHIAHAQTPQHGAGYWLAYSDEQIEASTALLRALIVTYPSIKEIITHWLISPGRKIDTNPFFPLDQIRERVLGNADPKPVKKADTKPAAPIADATVIASALNVRGLPAIDAAIGFKLRNGARVDIQEKYGDWYRIIAADAPNKGKTGFVFGKYVKLD